MADDVCLEIIKQGVQEWNEWRKNNSGELPNLSNADFQDADLREINFAGANLKGANLFDANLTGANLKNADLQGAILYEAKLKNADLRGANLLKADGVTCLLLESAIYDERTKVPEYIKLRQAPKKKDLNKSLLALVVFISIAGIALYWLKS